LIFLHSLFIIAFHIDIIFTPCISLRHADAADASPLSLSSLMISPRRFIYYAMMPMLGLPLRCMASRCHAFADAARATSHYAAMP